MNRIVCFLIIGLGALGVMAQASEGEDMRAPVVDGTQDVSRVAADLQRLEKYVYRTLGPDQLKKKEPVAMSPQGVGGSQDQINLLMKKHEEVAQAIPQLTARLEESEHTVQKLLDNNKTFIQYLTHYKKLIAEAALKQEAMEAKIAALQKGGAVLGEAPAPVDPESAPGDIPSLPPLDSPLEMPPVENQGIASQVTENAPVEDPVPEDVPLSVEDLEKKARAALLTADYDVARQTFEAMLERELSAEQGASAHYYLGEIAQLKKDAATASGHYLKAFQKAGNGDKAPKSLLKLSMALRDLGKEKEACASLSKLFEEYPKADAATLAMAETQKKAYKCQV